MDSKQMVDHLVKTAGAAGLKMHVLSALLKDMGQSDGAMPTLNFATGVLMGVNERSNGKPKAAARVRKQARPQAKVDDGLQGELLEYLHDKKVDAVAFSDRWSAWGLKVNPHPTDEMKAMAKELGPADFAPIRAVAWALWELAPEYHVIKHWVHSSRCYLPVARAKLLLVTTPAVVMASQSCARMEREARKSHDALFAS